MNSIYKKGINRDQQLLLPPNLNDYVGEENAVRAIDAYAESIDTYALGFRTKKTNTTDGQPAFHPKLLLKIYLYGYLNKIRSSRRLETEVNRNVELMWLVQGLNPSYKTISNFRKDNPKALKEVFKEFVLLCKNTDLITGELVAIDGAYLRANASKNQLLMLKNIQTDLNEIDTKIDNYLVSLETNDKEDERNIQPILLPKDIEKLNIKKQKLQEDLKLLQELNKTQYNKTDPDSSLMVKPAHNLIAYNAQIAVDSKFKFIVATKVSAQGNDAQELHSMALSAKEIIETQHLTVVADTGYDSDKEIKKCIDDNITPILPRANKQKAQEDKGKFTRDRFAYDNKADSYTCPNNQTLHKNSCPQLKNDKLNHVYRASSVQCKQCPMRNKCLPDKTTSKQIFRWEHESIIEEHTKTMKTDTAKSIIKQRGSIVEHPFGTIKRMLGWDHYLVRGKDKVSGENALIMFAYNFKRMLNLIGVDLFRKLVFALKCGDTALVKEEIRRCVAR